MTTKKTAISTAMLAMLMIGAPAGAAFAAKQPPEAELSARAEPLGPTEQALRQSQAAQAKADEHRQKLDELRRLGGAAYKGGLIREHEWQVAKYEGEARAALAAPLSPEAQHYLDLAREYRGMGGAAYRSGLVARAEDQARRHGAVLVVVSPPPAPTTAEQRPGGWSKPIQAWLESVK
jgi:GNAT superfamily N-acetyltransferase